MNKGHEVVTGPRQNAEQILAQSESVLREAVAIAFPETPDLNPIDAFPKPSQVRSESPDIPELTDERKAALAEKASELGFGRAVNTIISELGFRGAVAVLEGGQPHKMLAEARVVFDDKAADHRLIVVTASPHREIKNEAEIKSAERLIGRVGKTEYEVAMDIIGSLPGFRPDREPHVLDASYDIENGFKTAQEPTGQFTIMGHIGSAPVVIMKIDRRELGGGKYDRQPNAADVLGIVDAITREHGILAPLVHVTSGTYMPSRKVLGALASLRLNRVVATAAYGNYLLNEIKGENAPAPIDQLASELHVMAASAAELKKALES